MQRMKSRAILLNTLILPHSIKTKVDMIFKEIVMNEPNTPKLDPQAEKLKNSVDKGIDKADALYKQVKDKAQEYYEEGKHSVCEAQECVKEYTDELIHHVKEKPLSSLLIAGSIGFILSSLLRK